MDGWIGDVTAKIELFSIYLCHLIKRERYPYEELYILLHVNSITKQLMYLIARPSKGLLTTDALCFFFYSTYAFADSVVITQKSAVGGTSCCS
jgi:hypothetical protein